MSAQRFEPVVGELVIGCWSWGERRTWGYGERFGSNSLRAAVETLAEAGPVCFDTAESYARGASERLVGELAAKTAVDCRISTKFFPYPWRVTYGQFAHAIERSLRRLRRSRIDLYQIHHDVPAPLLDVWTGYLVRARRAGLIEAIGTSNLSRASLRRVAERVAAEGESVHAHQARYNLCDRRIEVNGVQDLCRRMGIVLLAHGPLGQGLLSGKYTAEHPPAGRRARHLTPELLRQTQPVRDLLRHFADRLPATVPAVALAWIRSRGAVPIVGVHDAQQAREARAGAEITLTPAMRRSLDAVTEPWRRAA